MKKIFAIFMSAMLIMFPAALNAQEIGYDGSAQTTVTCHVDSQYCVLIPETVTADGTNYNFTATQMDLCDGESVVIQVSGVDNGAITMATANNTRSIQALVYRNNGVLANEWEPVATFTNGILTSDGGFYILPPSDALPGDYTGVITFNISLQ